MMQDLYYRFNEIAVGLHVLSQGYAREVNRILVAVVDDLCRYGVCFPLRVSWNS